MDHSYPSLSSHHNSYDMNVDTNMELGTHNPYQRFLSPSPTRYSLGHQRATSVPSVYYSGFLDDSPIESPRRPREISPSYSSTSSPRHYRGRRHPGRHTRDSQLVNPDIIDRLDTATGYQYHHEGPYDAVYPERNHDSRQSPLEALRESNAEALKATPYHKIVDSISRHRPLDGVAYYPPGHTDREGQTYEYEEGYNMMSDYGNFMRIPGLRFTDEDFKNDPFYNSPHPKPFASIRRAFRRSRGDSA
ncbi:hypothetical protein P175DRAFT_0427887 [Aspergillus ochraceoroseus IBT 24754]|nr:uncharacterized protein P175DRAFT_0427887 [Aspergillus ochraceoroseus IBT 24754]PTU23907.1 hypothetical protein P175DRAFT_0427887 [Aspergillus ochraceoroseus IBT 24754]